MDYGLGLEVVVVVVLDELVGGVDVVTVLVVVSLVFSVLAGGFTTVVLFSVFFSAGEAAGVTTSVFCSQAPRSAALAKMQINFFIFGLVAHLGTLAESNRGNASALPNPHFRNPLPLERRFERQTVRLAHRRIRDPAIAQVDPAGQGGDLLARAFQSGVSE